MTVAEGNKNLVFCLFLVSLLDSLNPEILPGV